jgi:hypothetical protein
MFKNVIIATGKIVGVAMGVAIGMLAAQKITETMKK